MTFIKEPVYSELSYVTPGRFIDLYEGQNWGKVFIISVRPFRGGRWLDKTLSYPAELTFFKHGELCKCIVHDPSDW